MLIYIPNILVANILRIGSVLEAAPEQGEWYEMR